MKLHANVCSQWEWTKLRQLLVIVLLGLGYCFHVWTNQNSIRYR